MNKLITLIKIEIQNILATTNVVSPRFKKGRGIGLLTTLLPAGLICYMFTTYAFAFFGTLPYELRGIGLLILMLLVFVVTTSFLLYSAYGHLFGFSDYDFLMSLPINESQIFLSKTLAFVFIGYFYTLSAFIPIYIIYMMFYPIDILTIIQILLTFLSFPFFPIIISCIFSFIISFAGNRSRYKGAIKLVVSILALFTLLLGLSYLNTALIEDIVDLNMITQNFQKYLPHVYYSVMAFCDHNLLQQLLVSLISIATFAIFIACFSKLFIKINRALAVGFKRQDYHFQAQKRSAVMKALFRREWSKYISNITYVINTAFGPIMGLFSTIYFMMNPETAAGLTAGLHHSTFVLILCIVAYGAGGIASTTSSSISLEGKRIWIIKSLPVSIMDIFHAKILLNFVVTIPILLVCIVLYQIMLGIPFLYLFLFIGILIISCGFSSLVGIISNLYFPKLDWDREIYVIKNSMSVLISSLIEILFLFIIIGPIFLLLETSWVYPLGLVMMLVMSGVCVLLYFWLRKNGVKKFQQLM